MHRCIQISSTIIKGEAERFDGRRFNGGITWNFSVTLTANCTNYADSKLHKLPKNLQNLFYTGYKGTKFGSLFQNQSCQRY